MAKNKVVDAESAVEEMKNKKFGLSIQNIIALVTVLSTGIAGWYSFTGRIDGLKILEVRANKDMEERYPELAEKRVAFGLTQELQNVVSYIGRFNMIEADRDMQLAIRNDLKANKAKITTAKYSGYVTIYDFAVNLKEEIKAGKVETINETIVGIQVKLINNENTQYVVGSGQGRASTVGKGFLMNPNMAWNQSSLSSASNKAMETAVVNVIKAIDRRGW